MAKRFPWKSNYRSIPAFVTEALDQIEGRLIQIAATKKIPRTEIDGGQYLHVGLRVEHGRVVASGPVSPLADVGKWSERNAFGWDRKRHDWPMVPKTWTFESPNFGDGARNGWTMRSWTKDVYQHQVFEPQGMMIEPMVLEDRGGDHVVIKFALTPLLDRDMVELSSCSSGRSTSYKRTQAPRAFLPATQLPTTTKQRSHSTGKFFRPGR